MFCRSSPYSIGNAPPQSDVKRARTAVRSPRLFHRKHDRAKRRRAQPMRSLAPQHAPIFSMVLAEVGRVALPGNDQNKICPCVGGAPKKIAERLVRPRLCHAVQIDLVVDMRFSRKQFSFQTPVQRHNRVENRLRRFDFRLADSARRSGRNRPVSAETDSIAPPPPAPLLPRHFFLRVASHRR